MKVEGKLKAPKGKEKYWSIELPELEIYSQGKTQAEALSMICNAVEELVNIPQFKASVHMTKGLSFRLGGNDERIFIAFILKRIRSITSLGLVEVAEKLGSNSPNAYGRYEQGTSTPSIEKMGELLESINPQYELVLKRA